MSTSQKQLAPGCLALFGLPFLVAGLFMMGLGVKWWITYFRSASWEKVPVTILSVEWKSSRGSKGGTTYRVDCNYRYGYRSREYTNDRVSIEGGSSSDYRFHRHHYNRLIHHKETGHPLTAWVNPGNPQEAILFRETSSAMYALPPFGTVFVIVGGGLSFGGLAGIFKLKRKQALLVNNPGRPWRAEEKWKSFSIPSDLKVGLARAWGISVLLGFFVAVFLVALANDPHAPGFARILMGLFGLAALGFLGWAVYLAMRYLKYGNPQLALAQLPLVPGSPLNALLMIKKHLVSEHGVDCTLKCLSKLTTGSGKSQHTTVTSCYEKTINVQKDLTKSELLGSAIPIQLDLPADQPARDAEGNPKIEWVLEARAVTPGVDFAVKFHDLPVYLVEDPSLVERRTGKQVSD